MKNSENRISFIKGIEITDEKADTIYSVLNNEIKKRGGVVSLSWFGSDGASVIIGHKVAWKFKRDNPKVISIHCQQL